MSVAENMKVQRNSVKLVVRGAVVWLLGLGCAMGDFDPAFTSATEGDEQPPKVVFNYKLQPNEVVSKVAVKADGQDVIAKLVSYAGDEAKKTAILFLVDTSDARRGMEILQAKKLITAALTKANGERHDIGVYPFTGQMDMDFAPMDSPLEDVASKVKTMKAEGKNTILYGSIIKAITELEKVKADRKALVVISDWQSEDKVWSAKDFTEKAKKRLKDSRIVCHSIILVHSEKSELDVAEAITNVMHGQMIKVDPKKVTIPVSFVAGLYNDLESGGSAEIDLIGREQAKKLVLTVDVQGGKTYTFEHDRTEQLKNRNNEAVEKIQEETQAALDAVVKEAGEAIGKIDAATADVQVESKKIIDDATAKITATVDEAKKEAAEVKLAQEDAQKAQASLDKQKEDAKLKLEALVDAPDEEDAEPTEEDEAAAEASDAESSAEKRLFGLPMPWAIAAAVAAILVVIGIIITLTRKKPQQEDLGDFSMNAAPEPEPTALREFDFGNGTAICQTLPSANETVVAQLLFGDGGKYGVFPISKTAVRIGRGSDNDLTFKNDSVSRHHAEILCKRDGKFIITDLDSGNGVLVNGVAVTQYELRPGDSVEVGEVCFTFGKQS